jgi:arsenate reductase
VPGYENELSPEATPVTDKRRVLILCTGNSARSQMAEGLFRHEAGDDFEVFSAGTKPTTVRPEAIAVMDEIGIDISGHRSKSVDEFAGQPFDYVITVCDNANESCPVFPGATVRLHWPFEDPAAVQGSEEDRLAAFRRVRDRIHERMIEFFREKGWWIDEFDLAALDYPAFLTFFFDRPVVEFKDQYDLFRKGFDYFVAKDPGVVVGHLRTMCRSFTELSERYSAEQIDQGLWAVFGAGINCEQFLFDPSVDRDVRIECIESMYLPFRDVVVKRTGDPRDSFYWMWWDMILTTFWLSTGQWKFNGAGLAPKQYIEKLREYSAASPYKYSDLNDAQKLMADSMYETLLKILALDHPGCQWSALHGLGHLHHPLGRDTLRRYLDQHRSQLSDDDVRWIEMFRERIA